MRDNLVEGIVRAPPAVRAQLGESAKHVVHFEFPERWPALMPAVCSLLTSQVRSLSPQPGARAQQSRLSASADPPGLPQMRVRVEEDMCTAAWW